MVSLKSSNHAPRDDYSPYPFFSRSDGLDPIAPKGVYPLSAEPNPHPASTLFSDEQEPLFNEIASYKAVVPSALISPILGGLSILSFIHYYFAFSGLLAIVLGVHALRKIKRYPDLWMGEKFAKVGIVLGLLFCLSSQTISATQAWMRIRAASNFAKQYGELIKTGSVEDVLFYHGVPEAREGKNAGEVVDMMKKSSPNPQAFDDMTKPLREVKALVKGGDTLEYVHLEAQGPQEFRIFAHPLFKISGPGIKGSSSQDVYLLVRMNGRVINGKFEWMVDEFKYPYVPNSQEQR